ncbi:MAG TPA: hypothetical protein VGS19_00555 [Streptosporangiaceae bacterium]|nr:hypothetical protein [Streptosporangiaceae bacterium]
MQVLSASSRWWRPLSRGQRVVVGGSAGVMLAAVVGVLVWAAVGTPAPRARLYINYTACLLTGARGVVGPQAARAWAGMEQASTATQARVEYVPVLSGPTVGDALPVLTGLVQRHCGVVIATGSAEVAAVDAEARHYPAVRFAVTGGAAISRRVSELPAGGSQEQVAVDQLVTTAVQQST